MASEVNAQKGTGDTKSENKEIISEDYSRDERDGVESQEFQQQDDLTTDPDGDNNNKSDTQEELLNQLENIELTDDDTEILLEEALAMNKKLKEILKQQEVESESRKASRRPGNGSRSAGSKHPVLPPIKSGPKSKQNGIYSVRLSRPAQSGSPGKRTSPQNRQYSSSAQFSKETSNVRRVKPQKSAQASSDRPEWNERFSFS